MVANFEDEYSSVMKFKRDKEEAGFPGVSPRAVGNLPSTHRRLGGSQDSVMSGKGSFIPTGDTPLGAQKEAQHASSIISGLRSRQEGGLASASDRPFPQDGVSASSFAAQGPMPLKTVVRMLEFGSAIRA